MSGRAEWYKTLDPADKDKFISQVQADKEAHRNSLQHDVDHKIIAFQSKIREGSYYICSVCNRILCRKTVIQSKEQMYNTQQELFTELYTHDSFPSWKLKVMLRECHGFFIVKQIEKPWLCSVLL